jgi:hypothetical protein
MHLQHVEPCRIAQAILEESQTETNDASQRRTKRAKFQRNLQIDHFNWLVELTVKEEVGKSICFRKTSQDGRCRMEKDVSCEKLHW